MSVVELEARIENYAVQYAESLGMLSLKLTPAGQRGWMDRLFITTKGVHFYMEFKRKNEKLRKLQEHRRWQLQKRHCFVYGPVDTKEHAKEIIDYYANLRVPEANVGAP